MQDKCFSFDRQQLQDLVYEKIFDWFSLLFLEFAQFTV